MRKAQPQSWIQFASRVSGLKYGAFFAIRQRYGVDLYIDIGDKDVNEAVLRELQKQSEAIEGAIRGAVEWQLLPEARACRVAVFRAGTIDVAERELEKIRRGMVSNLLNFRETFGPKLRPTLETARQTGKTPG